MKSFPLVRLVSQVCGSVLSPIFGNGFVQSGSYIPLKEINENQVAP